MRGDRHSPSSSARRPSPALIVAVIALVAAMSGAAAALPGRNSVDSGDIRNNTIKAKDLGKGAVRSKQIQSRAIKGADVGDDALKGRHVLEDKLEAVPEAKSVSTVSPFGGSATRLEATEAESAGAAQAAAPPTELARRGQLSVYAKCFRDASAGETHGRVYVATEANGAIFDASAGTLSGGAGGFLDVGTPEADRVLLATSVAGPDAGFERGEFFAIAPDATAIGGRIAIAVKDGTPPAGDGIYGAGNACLFGGDAIG